MIRPRLRPTISRRAKYLTVVPRAEKKLEREARRGSHDLRKLVGHANFLDVLIDNFDDNQQGNDLASPTTEPGPARVQAQDDHESESDSSEDWSSDSSDDQEHALTRTISNQHQAKAALDETKTAIAETGDVDYFSRVSRHGTPVMRSEDVSPEEEVKNAGVSVTFVSPLSDLNDAPSMSSPGSSSSDSVENEEIIEAPIVAAAAYDARGR